MRTIFDWIRRTGWSMSATHMRWPSWIPPRCRSRAASSWRATPEAFELERSGRRIYVNVPSAHHVAVVDRGSGKVAETWKIEGAGQNFAMALDTTSKRLFVATRQPAALLVFDTQTGKRTAQLPLCGDADDLFFDAQRRQLYAVCGEGVVQIVRQRDPDHYETAGSIPTSRGARTGLFIPRLSTLFVAVPATPGSPAQLRAYAIR